jgi:hypothetical protein
MYACDMKEAGGLGLKDLGIQNICLLLKLIHKLHSEIPSSLAAWVQKNASIASLTGELHGQHWDMLRSLLAAASISSYHHCNPRGSEHNVLLA